MEYFTHQMFDLYLAFWGLKVVGTMDMYGKAGWKIVPIRGAE